MSPSMQAVVYYGPNDIRVEAVPRPTCGVGELLVRVDACAVCGTDLKTWRRGNPRIAPPRIMGHEFTGIIEEVGVGAYVFHPGQRVVMATSISCGACLYCQKGWPNLCVNLSPMGFGYDGGMAEYVVIPERAVRNDHVVTISTAVPAEHAALAEPISCAFNACENAQVSEGATVVVVGAGPMGVINGCVAREFGARKIILAEINPTRLEQAAAFGFDRLVNPSVEDLRDVVLSETDGLGADVVIVAAPAAAPQGQAVHLTRKRGTVCLFASLPKGEEMVSLDSRAIHYNELRVVGTSDSTVNHVWSASQALVNRSIPADRLATHVLGLDGIFEAYQLMESGDALRVILKP